jgi:hypothetical protein
MRFLVSFCAGVRERRNRGYPFDLRPEQILRMSGNVTPILHGGWKLKGSFTASYVKAAGGFHLRIVR